MLINALGQALFESCGQALLIYMALQIITLLFPGISPKTRYRMGYFALTAICGWFLITLVQAYSNAMAMPNYSLLLNNKLIGSSKFTPTLLQQAEMYINKYAKYITGLYLTGLLLQAFRLAGGLVHINYIRKQKNLVQDSLWSQRAGMLAKTLVIGKKVQLYFSEYVQIPLTIGHLKPLIIFPLALINNLDNDQIEAILLHELAHIKRHDYLLNLLQCIMETILCFNPFAWLISKDIREVREYCCDDMVIGTDYNNYSYASALFIIAQQNTQSYSLAMASAGSKKYPLLNRIKRLHNMKTNYSLPKFNLVVIIAIAAIGALLAWGIPQYSFAKATTVKKIKIVRPDKLATPAPVRNSKDNTIAQPYQQVAATATPDSTANAAVHTKSFKIVINKNGSQKVYNSVDELPDSEKAEFLQQNASLKAMAADSQQMMAMADFTKSPEWQKQMTDIKMQAEAISKQFTGPEYKKQAVEYKKLAEKMSKECNSPEYKKQVAEYKKLAEKMSKAYSSPEYKKQMADMQEKMHQQFNSPEWKAQMDAIAKQSAEIGKAAQKQFNSPEWKVQMDAIAKQSAEIGKAAQKQFNSPEWKKQIKELQESAEKMGEQFNSAEWQKQMANMEKSVEDGVKITIDKAQQDSVQVVTPVN